jgi:hypothetical protein
MKIIPWTCLAGALALFACEKETVLLEEEADLLSTPSYFQINLTGQASADGSSFSTEGCLILTPGLEVEGAVDFGNGFNTVDIGLVCGNSSNSLGDGSIWFFSNSHLCIEGSTCNKESKEAALDLAFVEADKATRTVAAEVDPSAMTNVGAVEILKNNRLASFTGGTTESGTQMFSIVRGRILLELSPDGRTVEGTVTMVGKSRQVTGLVTYSAEFTGLRSKRAKCW